MKHLQIFWAWSLFFVLLLTACAPAQPTPQEAAEPETETVTDEAAELPEVEPAENDPQLEEPEPFVPPKLDQSTDDPLDFPKPGSFRTLASVGLGSCLVVAPNGDLVGWGPCERGEFPGYHEPLSFEERRVFLKNIRQVYDGFTTQAALDRDGNLFVWSTPQDRELGHTSAQATESPGVYLVMEQVRMADIGMGYVAAIREDGSLWVWGSRNFYGQMIDDSLEDIPEPRKLLDNAAFVYCDLLDTFVVTEDHELYAIGCVAGSTLRCIATGVVEVNKIGGGFSVLTTDGRVYQCRSARTGPEDPNDEILYELRAENAQHLLPGGYVDTDGTLWFLPADQPPVRVLDNVVERSALGDDTFLCQTSDGMLRELERETFEEVWSWPMEEISPR